MRSAWHPGEQDDLAKRIVLDGVWLDALTQDEAVLSIMAALDRRQGGLLLTVNVDIMRQLRSGRHRQILDRASVVVADGMPLVWASWLQGGHRLPERVTGADLLWRLSAAAARRGRTVFLLGAAPGIADKAAGALLASDPDLRVVGTCSPPWAFEHDPDYLSALSQRLGQARPDIVFVALGFPKQDELSLRLLEELPATWFIGCGGALDMAAGEVPRARLFFQHIGAEWVHRLWHEPRRLARRYLVDDLPYALGMLLRAMRARMDRSGVKTR